MWQHLSLCPASSAQSKVQCLMTSADAGYAATSLVVNTYLQAVCTAQSTSAAHVHARTEPSHLY
jgi:hypothetical protein